jgi:hypothetical protein
MYIKPENKHTKSNLDGVKTNCTKHVHVLTKLSLVDLIIIIATLHTVRVTPSMYRYIRTNINNQISERGKGGVRCTYI